MKKLLIIVGAGASIDFGLPSVPEIDRILDNAVSESFQLASNPNSNLYRYFKERIQEYYCHSPKEFLRKDTNFEEVLYQLNLLAPFKSDPYWQHGSNALLALQLIPEVLQYQKFPLAMNGEVLKQLGIALHDALINHFIDACEGLQTSKSAELLKLGEFLRELEEHFEIGIVTLNYDNVFSKSRPGLHTGFDPVTGKFDPLSVLGRTGWSFIYHLHGSVHFAMTGTQTERLHGITWTQIPTKGHVVSASGRNLLGTTEGAQYPQSIFIAGYGKTQQILRQPFRTYFAQINRLTYEADSFLFLGYGFGDAHLNALFPDPFLCGKPAVVIDWADDNQDPLLLRSDRWQHQLLNTLPINLSEVRGSPPPIHELKRSSAVEILDDKSRRLAVWYDGLLKACDHSGTILSHLF